MDTVAVIEYQWDETMRTGDDKIDEQHKELIRQMNLLMHAMTRGEGTSQIDSLMQFLVSYASSHFSYEEGCMNRYHCPVAQTNAQAHAQFVEKLATFRQQLAAHTAGDALLTIQMMRELSTWLVGHIRRIDTQLLKCAKPA